MIHHGHQFSLRCVNLAPAPTFNPFEKIHRDIGVLERYRLIHIATLFKLGCQRLIVSAIRAERNARHTYAQQQGKKHFFHLNTSGLAVSIFILLFIDGLLLLKSIVRPTRRSLISIEEKLLDVAQFLDSVRPVEIESQFSGTEIGARDTHHHLITLIPERYSFGAAPRLSIEGFNGRGPVVLKLGIDRTGR